MLYGRQAEQARIDALLGGPAGALVVRGEAGIGKSALLEYAEGRAPGHVLRVTGVESEAELPFAALHLLLRPVLDRVAALPPQQAEALLGALGLGAATRGDRFLVGLATLSLLVELSADEPLLCLVDDAQWLDSESADALVFAARRLYAEPVAVLFAAREGGGVFPARGLPEVRLDKLDPEAAGRLLAEQAAGLPLAVRDQLLAEARGNPLALLELPRMLGAEERAGAFTPLAFSFGSAEPVTDRVLAGFRDRVATLPAATRSCLLVAALDDRGELKVLAGAIRALGASLADFAEAERAGLVRVCATGVAFRHPLVRTAVLLACDIAARMAAHRALAQAVDEDRRAWHLAAVTLEPHEAVAAELESLGLRARRRGGQATVSAAYARAAELSADPADAVRRWTAAAGAAIEAGLNRRAGELVGTALRHAGPVTRDGAVPAELARVRARLAFEAGRPLEASRLLLESAEAADHATRLPLLGIAGFYTWTSAAHPDQIELARRAEELCPDGEGLAAAVRAISRGFSMVLEGSTGTAPTFRDDLGSVPFELRMIITYHAMVRAEREGMLESAVTLVRDCRAEGRLGRLPQAMTVLAIAQLLDGRHRAARATVAEGQALSTDVGQPFWSGYLAGVQAWLCGVAGAEEEHHEAAAQAVRYADDRSWLPPGTWVAYGRTMLDLGLGRYEAVLDRLDRVTEGGAHHAFVWRYAWPDYVEAAVRVGTPRRADGMLRRYADWAEGTGQAGPLAVLHRARALLAPDERAEPLYERALALSGQPFQQARTRLVFGEWLRRHQRRAEARVQLQAAMDAFDRLDAAPWSARAAAELRAAGATPARNPRAGDPLAVLTPQELQVVQLAVTGASNREIGAQLFLSPRTVAYHLYKAFPKLGITSRGELARLVPPT
ncbi:ATP-binding protein [Nonomuraea rhodomycinica]|uniref:AAA family ATPase n=1 Tax=Nonomuraea rhodomycinica TaxID=1712872 RepID=A0A7Y6INB4_9ACTN|nr:helix-turn-helix transcriptional regulator [Nonomuraea rhodomycinica]NUW41143.1 AAA family ATPase [Nonomuraea rhodomycinica]